MGHFKKKSLSIFYTIVNIIVYILFLYLFKIELGIKSIAIGIVSFMLYYVLDIFEIEETQYKIRVFIESLLANVLMYFIALSILGKTSLVLFFTMFFFQNIIKYILINFFIKEKNILVLGNNYKSSIVKEIIKNKKNYLLVGSVHSGNKAIGNIENIENTIDNYKVDKIVITLEGVLAQTTLEKLLQIKLSGIQIFNFSDFYEKLEERVSVKSINEKWFLFGHGFEILHSGFHKRLKRLIDIIFSILIFIPTLPFFLMVPIIIKLESRGPIFFKQNRIGKGNKVFKIVKFRSMRLHDEKEHSMYAGKKDKRITSFGKFMRKTRIDELPQLWNVFKGDMSFVGPRAEWEKLVSNYVKEIPFYNLRHSVKPGLTGWAQVNYPYGANLTDTIEKLKYDLYYIKYQSISLDLIIFLRTIKIVVLGKGR